jgi:hypothetical protein
MAIVDDYAAISEELRRLQGERSPPKKPDDDACNKPAWRHPMRATIAGDLLYRRLVRRTVK